MLLGLHFDGKKITTFNLQHILPRLPRLEELLIELNDMLPKNPLDDLKTKLGGEQKVAEVAQIV